MVPVFRKTHSPVFFVRTQKTLVFIHGVVHREHAVIVRGNPVIKLALAGEQMALAYTPGQKRRRAPRGATNAA